MSASTGLSFAASRTSTTTDSFAVTAGRVLQTGEDGCVPMLRNCWKEPRTREVVCTKEAGNWMRAERDATRASARFDEERHW